MLIQTRPFVSTLVNRLTHVIAKSISYQVQDIKNQHLIFVEDPEGNLPYMK